MLHHVERFDDGSQTLPDLDGPAAVGAASAGHYYLECRDKTQVVWITSLDLPETYWVSATIEQVSEERRSFGLAFGSPGVRTNISMIGKFYVFDTRLDHETDIIPWTEHQAVSKGSGRINTLCVAVSPTELSYSINGELVAVVQQTAEAPPLGTQQLGITVDNGVHLKIHELRIGDGVPHTLPSPDPIRATTGPAATPSLAAGYTCVARTDAATVVMFHPDDLAHHAETDIAWVYDTSKARDDFGNGHLVAFSTAADGGFRVRLTDGDLTAAERTVAGSTEEFRVNVRHGRLYVGSDDDLPGLEQQFDPMTKTDGWFELPNGDYKLTVTYINRWTMESEAARDAMADYVFTFEPTTNPYTVIAPASAPTIEH